MRFCFKGRYKCEVSAEAPNFQTVFGIANMSIVGQWHQTLFLTVFSYIEEQINQIKKLNKSNYFDFWRLELSCYSVE